MHRPHHRRSLICHTETLERNTLRPLLLARPDAFLICVLPWHLYMVHRFGSSFLTEYLGFHVLSRATHQIEDHITHWWYYLWVLLISAAPFVLLYPFAIANSFRQKKNRAWAIFAVVVIVFFTVVQTRLPHYIAPAYPAFALLTSVYLADRLRELQQRRQHSPTSFWGTAAVLAIVLCIVGALLTSAPRRTLHQAKVGVDIVSAEKESIQLLRNCLQPAPASLWPAPHMVAGQRAINRNQRLLLWTPGPPGPATASNRRRRHRQIPLPARAVSRCPRLRATNHSARPVSRPTDPKRIFL